VTDEGPSWSTTKTIATVKDAVEQAMAKEQPPSIVEAKVPLKLVVSLSLFLLTQALTVAGLYYDLRSDVRSLQEAQGDLDALAAESDVEAVRAKINGLQESLANLETDMRQPPTNLDHLRVIGDIKADLRLLDQRVQWLEKSR
tara:strand:+ start:88 stop:516 length:429 start_codon:yes stop_codon:yes gene_type:complete